VYDGNYWITQVLADTGHDFELNYAEDELGNITSSRSWTPTISIQN
jgi:hypothetical protein